MADENNSVVPPVEGTVPPAGPETWELTVYGEKKVVTKDEAIKLAQRGVAADQAFQEAAKVKARYESDHEVVESLRALQSGFDENIARKALSGMGLSGADLEAAVEAAKSQVESAGQETPNPAPIPTPLGRDPNKPIGFRDLDKETREILGDYVLEKQNKMLEQAIAADPVLKYNYKKDPAGTLAAAQKVLRRRVLETGRGVGDGNHLPEVVGELRSLQQMFGTPGGATPGSPGLGPAPSTAGNSLYPTKEPQRVPATDREHDDYIVKKMGFLVAQASIPH